MNTSTLSLENVTSLRERERKTTEAIRVITTKISHERRKLKHL